MPERDYGNIELRREWAPKASITTDYLGGLIEVTMLAVGGAAPGLVQDRRRGLGALPVDRLGRCFQWSTGFDE